MLRLKFSLYFFLFLYLSSVWCQETSELRGVWITPRLGSRVWTKAEIADAMQNAARHNFNIVYFNVWSRGWTLWQSEAFFRETGFYCDPATEGRDLLMEAVAEARQNGLEIEAWFEYGFVSWWSGNNMASFPKGPLFANHPEWLAKNSKGSDEFPIGNSGIFYWMNHNHPGVHQFLISLSKEIAQKYNVSGIELDRIRYPGLDCGYDEYTVELYKNEHNGIKPPEDPTDVHWKRWRADRLIYFQKIAYEAIKGVNPKLMVSNAPSHYSAGDDYPAYDNFLQDWRAWLNIGKVDYVLVQMYVQANLLATYIPSALRGVRDPSKVFVGVAGKTSSYTLPASQVSSLIKTARNAGLRGSSFWYYNDLVEQGYFDVIQSQVYQDSVPVPFEK